MTAIIVNLLSIYFVFFDWIVAKRMGEDDEEKEETVKAKMEPFKKHKK